jgi:hypothetical protein
MVQELPQQEQLTLKMEAAFPEMMTDFHHMIPCYITEIES